MKVLDTYSLMEIAAGNKKFLPYSKNEFIITDLTLSEFYLVILKKFNEKTARFWMRRLEAYSQPVPLSIFIESMAFKYQNKKKVFHFSMLKDISFLDHITTNS